MSKLAVQRLLREQEKLQKAPNKQILVVPNTENIFEWHFVLHNLDNSPYEGGQFHGKLLIPAEYPMKPPTLIFVTPQGRFKPGEKICLQNLFLNARSFTSYHPESWSTSWTIESMLIGLISFMHNNEQTVGSVTTSDYEKRRLAKGSVKFNLENPSFTKIFKPHYETLGLNRDGQILKFEEASNGGNPNLAAVQDITMEDDHALNTRKVAIFIGIGVILIMAYLFFKATTRKQKYD